MNMVNNIVKIKIINQEKNCERKEGGKEKKEKRKKEEGKKKKRERKKTNKVSSTEQSPIFVGIPPTN